MRNQSQIHIAEDTLEHLRALRVTAGNQYELAQGANLAAAVPEATGQTVTSAHADQR